MFEQTLVNINSLELTSAAASIQHLVRMAIPLSLMKKAAIL